MAHITVGEVLLDAHGNGIGTITDIISDPVTIEPEWLTVRIGRLGGEHLVPVGAVESLKDGGVSVPFQRDQVKKAPRVKNHAGPERSERDALYQHYGMQLPSSS